MFNKLINSISNITSYEKIMGVLGNNPLAAVVFAAVESFIPPLPLIGIVTFNIALYGPVWGFLLSWIGTSAGCTCVFLLIRHVIKSPVERMVRDNPKVKKGKQWIKDINVLTLFTVTILPFTPSAFLNLIFGLSDYDARKYLLTICTAKFLMIGFLALFGVSFVEAFKDPRMIVLSLVLVTILYVLSKWITKKHHL